MHLQQQDGAIPLTSGPSLSSLPYLSSPSSLLAKCLPANAHSAPAHPPVKQLRRQQVHVSVEVSQVVNPHLRHLRGEHHLRSTGV